MRIAAVDLVSNTCFPVLAAAELGFFKYEGLEARIELVPMLGATKRSATVRSMPLSPARSTISSPSFRTGEEPSYAWPYRRERRGY